MNGAIEQTSSPGVLPTPRTSLQNIGEKKDEDDKNAQRNGDTFQAFGADGFTFLDFLDIINPLQHIPFVGDMYREITGDVIDPGSRIAGATLFGGPIGTVVAMANVAVEESTGQDIGDHMMALILGTDDNLDTEDIQLANQPVPSEFATAAGGTPKGLSPITTNAEVLEWAQRESARTAELFGGQARQKTPEKIASVGTTDVAANIEVLNWARQEAAHARSAQMVTAATAQNVYQQDVQKAGADHQEAARNNSDKFAGDQAQLAGAAAPLGGWFTETMLLAMAKYDETAQLRRPVAERTVEQTVDISE